MTTEDSTENMPDYYTLASVIIRKCESIGRSMYPARSEFETREMMINQTAKILQAELDRRVAEAEERQREVRVEAIETAKMFYGFSQDEDFVSIQEVIKEGARPIDSDLNDMTLAALCSHLALIIDKMPKYKRSHNNIHKHELEKEQDSLRWKWFKAHALSMSHINGKYNNVVSSHSPCIDDNNANYWDSVADAAILNAGGKGDE